MYPYRKKNKTLSVSNINVHIIYVATRIILQAKCREQSIIFWTLCCYSDAMAILFSYLNDNPPHIILCINRSRRQLYHYSRFFFANTDESEVQFHILECLIPPTHQPEDVDVCLFDADEYANFVTAENFYK